LDVQQTLLNYETEVAVLAHIDPDDRLLTIPYRRHPVFIFTNRDHRFAGRPEILLRELEGERVIAREAGSTTRRAVEAALREKNVNVDASIEIGSREAIREAVIRGLGIGYVSEAEFVSGAPQQPDDPCFHGRRVGYSAGRVNGREHGGFFPPPPASRAVTTCRFGTRDLTPAG
jgi:DNA-binding transcriptional LysR family regulator